MIPRHILKLIAQYLNFYDGKKKHHDTPLLNKNNVISNLKEKANSFSAYCSQVYITDENFCLSPLIINNC